MTKDEALAAAERVLALVNSRPWTPTREEVAEAIGYVREAAYAYPAAFVSFTLRDGLSRLKPDEMIQSEEF